MAKGKGSKSKSKVPAVKEKKAGKSKVNKVKIPNSPVTRINPQNRVILMEMKDCLELTYEREMNKLGLHKLSINDVITFILVIYAKDNKEVADQLDIDNRMIKIMQMSEVE